MSSVPRHSETAAVSRGKLFHKFVGCANANKLVGGGFAPDDIVPAPHSIRCKPQGLTSISEVSLGPWHRTIVDVKVVAQGLKMGPPGTERKASIF
jgi:hypothetical protein